jgi:hypothetical protein
MKVRATGDLLDAELIEQTVHTQGYQLVAARMREMLVHKVAELRSGANMDQTNRARGFLDAVERCLELPKILIAESRAAGKKK